jgi:hypothetical protein
VCFASFNLLVVFAINPEFGKISGEFRMPSVGKKGGGSSRAGIREPSKYAAVLDQSPIDSGLRCMLLICT